MSDHDSTTRTAAQELWLRFAGTDSSVNREHVLDTADRVLTALDADLRRWAGAEGYGALLRRATAIVEVQHPALRHITDLAMEASPSGNGRVHPASEIAEGMIALLAALMELLNRIVGAEMGARLMGNVGVPSLRGVVSTSNGNQTDD